MRVFCLVGYFGTTKILATIQAHSLVSKYTKNTFAFAIPPWTPLGSSQRSQTKSLAKFQDRIAARSKKKDERK